MKASELRSKSIDDLKKELLSLFKELFNLRFQKGASQTPQKSNLFKKVRKAIARVKTILNEKGLKV